ncbi:MAG: aminopeptidase YwaD [Planctomycetota bacterium]|jgi:aminopeptidase YwaD
MKNVFVIFIAAIYLTNLNAQLSQVDDLSSHVYFLSDDKLEGRGTGSEGEKMAQSYIASHFNEAGLKPYGEKGYIQPFNFTLGKKMVNTNFLNIENKALKLEDDYFPLVYAANGFINSSIVNVGFGIDAGELYNDYAELSKLEGKVFAINLSSPDGIHPHSKYKDYTDYKTRVSKAKEKGAVAVIFYNTEKHVDDPHYDIKRNVQDVELPVIFIQRPLNDLLKNNSKISLSIDMVKDERVGENVIGFIDNRAENTIVIGAHYDHLGWGKDGGSLYKGKPTIHNGADDNASGVSIVIELAKHLKNSSNTKNNYLFICFSAEELGLIGSKSFTLNPTIDLSSVNYMINFDMVGRLDEQTKKLSVGGVGTASAFQELIKNGKNNYVDLVTKQSGMGPSDHASFYLKNIPVLFLFTGTHADYHKPSDDSWKINFNGMQNILEYSADLITKLDSRDKLVFQKTKDESSQSRKRKFSVTLGVVPNYMFDGKGMKIDAVTEGKPAHTGGILAGDIVTRMGTVEITDMTAYMMALGKFKKGDSTKVEVLRNNGLRIINITF